jgi:hypothetical protein
MDGFAELWRAAQQAGPFSTLVALTAAWVLYKERNVEREKYDELVRRFIDLSGNTSATLKDWRDVLVKAKDP